MTRRLVLHPLTRLVLRRQLPIREAARHPLPQPANGRPSRRRRRLQVVPEGGAPKPVEPSGPSPYPLARPNACTSWELSSGSQTGAVARSGSVASLAGSADPGRSWVG